MPRNDFDKMMDNPGIEGEISESFPDGFRQEGLLSGRVPKELQIQTATAFAPIDPDSGRGKQNERAKPATAWTSPDRIVLNEEPPRRYYEPQLSFTIQLKDKDGLVNLDIDYIPDINGHLDQDRCRWSMVPEKRADKKLFDLNYVNVDADTAWNFELTASHAVGEDRLPLLNRFLHQDYFRVKADRKLRLDPNNADLLLALKPLPGLTVMSVHQRKIWKYSILPGEQYRLELACVQPFRAGAVEWSTLRIPLTKKESYWTTHITSGHWSEKLSADGDLGIARSAEWTVTSQDLFPPSNTDADGFAELVTRVDRLAVALKDCIVRPDAAAVAAQPIAPTPSQPAAKAPSQSPAKPPAKTPKKPLPKR